MTGTAEPEPEIKGSLERLLGLFAEVRAGEGPTALLLALNVFLLLTAYYIVKPVREALILAGEGAEVKSYASAGQAVLLLGAVPLYAAMASRWPRRRLINMVTLFFAACMVVFYGLALAKIPYLGVFFFLWVGIFNLMVIAQFWSFANDVYTPEEGKRLFPIVAFGASLGAVTGSVIAGILIAPLWVAEMLVVAAVILAASLTITNYVDARERKRQALKPAPQVEPSSQEDRAAEKHADEPMAKGGAFRLVLGNRYLLLIGLLMLFLNWVNSTGEYILGRVVEDWAQKLVAAGQTGGLDEGQYIGTFYSEFFSVVNVVGVLMQLFVVSRILKYFGVRVALLVLPVIALTGYATIVLLPVLAVVRWIKTAENATDYSLQNTVRNVLFLPTTREEKYKAKQAIDTFFVRMGDVMPAVLVFVGTSFLAFGTKHFAMVNMALVVVWIILAVAIGGRYSKLAKEKNTGAPLAS